jgi:hypothetical protein
MTLVMGVGERPTAGGRENVNAGGTDDADEALPAAVAVAHASLLSTCFALDCFEVVLSSLQRGGHATKGTHVTCLIHFLQ